MLTLNLVPRRSSSGVPTLWPLTRSTSLVQTDRTCNPPLHISRRPSIGPTSLKSFTMNSLKVSLNYATGTIFVIFSTVSMTPILGMTFNNGWSYYPPSKQVGVLAYLPTLLWLSAVFPQSRLATWNALWKLEQVVSLPAVLRCRTTLLPTLRRPRNYLVSPLPLNEA